MAIYSAKVDAGRSTVTWDWEGAWKRAEVVLTKQEHLPAYSMRIVKARIGQKYKAGTTFTLGTNHRHVVSGLYYVSRQGETYVCLVNKTAEEVVIGDNKLLGEHVPVNSEDIVTLEELVTVQEPPAAKTAVKGEPTPEKLQLIVETIQGQGVFVHTAEETIAGGSRSSSPDSLSRRKSNMGHWDAVPHKLRTKSDEPAYVKQFPIPAAHLIFEQIDKLLALGVIREDWASPHNSPVFAVKKPHSEELQFVIDMRKVNEIIWEDFHSFLDISSCLQRLGGLDAKYLTALDLVNAY